MRILLGVFMVCIALGVRGQDGDTPSSDTTYLYNIAVFQGAPEAVVWRISYTTPVACEAAKGSAVIRTVPLNSPGTLGTTVDAKELVACSTDPNFPTAIAIGSIPITQLGQ